MYGSPHNLRVMYDLKDARGSVLAEAMTGNLCDSHTKLSGIVPMIN